MSSARIERRAPRGASPGRGFRTATLIAFAWASPVISSCVHLPERPALSAAAEPPPVELLASAGRWISAPASVTQRLVVDRNSDETLLVAQTQESLTGARRVAVWTELGATVVQMVAEPGGEVAILRNPHSLPEVFLRRGVWHDCTLLFAAPEAHHSVVRVYADQSTGITSEGGELEWIYSGPPWKQEGVRSLSGNRIRWQASFDGESGPPEGLHVIHYDLGYSVSITVAP